MEERSEERGDRGDEKGGGWRTGEGGGGEKEGGRIEKRNGGGKRREEGEGGDTAPLGHGGHLARIGTQAWLVAAKWLVAGTGDAVPHFQVRAADLDGHGGLSARHARVCLDPDAVG